MTVRIGTSGWQYREWRGPVYPAGLSQARWLEAYATVFDTVESNSAFYRLPERSTVQRWADSTPDGFRWAVKASRYLTHVRRLRDPEDAVDRLVERIGALGPKRGPVLLQLPPRFGAVPDRLERTLKRFPRGWRVAVEVRDDRWLRADVRAVLERHAAALCLADRRGPVGPAWRTADWTYLRLHEGTARPWSCYDDRSLATWARSLLEGWGRDGEVWVFFNNDTNACAPRDAIRFARMCQGLGIDVSRVGSLPAA